MATLLYNKFNRIEDIKRTRKYYDAINVFYLQMFTNVLVLFLDSLTFFLFCFISLYHIHKEHTLLNVKKNIILVYTEAAPSN